jgi:filamentous hemagglutinin family protein
MKARVDAYVQKRINRSPETIRSNVRPLCQAIALLVATGAVSGTAHAAGLVNLANAGAGSARSAAAQAAGIVNLGVGVSPTQALQASQTSLHNLATAAQGIAQQIASQQAAATAAANTPSNVPNGLAVGGLQVAPGVSSNTNSPNLWVNANLPAQTVNANGTVTVDVQQTAPNAVLTWQTMNVGKQTTLNFDQSAGTQTNGANNWIVLNRVMDPSGAPSQILGSITAQGTVLVINRNGILFGPGSQVNVHSLVASSLDLLNKDDYGNSSTLNNYTQATGNLAQTASEIVASNNLFLATTGGLAALEAGTSTTTGSLAGVANEVLGLGNNVSVSSTSQLQTPGNITIAPGASINTAADGSASNGGFVLIAAPNVTNAGNITVAPTGQVVLAAGVGVGLQTNTNNAQVLLPELTGKIGLQTGPATSIDITPAGTLTNTGLIQADRGEINLLGSTVNQNGVVGVTTSVNTPGTITISTVDEYIANTPTGAAYYGTEKVGTSNTSTTTAGNVTNRAGQLTFGPGSVTAILADDDGQTATSASGQTTFTPGSVTVTAGSVWFQSGSLLEAPGATVSVAALTPSAAEDATPPGDTAVQGRIYVDSGATIDVSGLANVQLPISDILLTLSPAVTESELADSPLLRDSFLNGLKGVTVDSTLSGTNSDGVQWVGSPILNLSGDISLIPRTVDQLMTSGGTITLSGNEVMTANGSLLNLNGGYVHYLGGMVDTTRLVDTSGAIVPIGEASPYDTYVGVAGQFVATHPRWGVTQTWLNPLLSGGAYEGDYIVGGNAGTLNVFASSAMVLDGTITAQAFGGEKQVQGNDQPTGGTFNLGGALLAQKTQGADSETTGESGTVILQGQSPQLSTLAQNFNASTPIDTATLAGLSSTDPGNVLDTTVVPVDTLNSGGFANVSVTMNNATNGGIVVAQGTKLDVQAGGTISFTNQGGDVTVLGSLVAPGGTISISSGGGGQATIGGGIVVGTQGLLSVSGQWVNNDPRDAAGTTAGDSEYINGGKIALSTALAASNGTGSSGTTDISGSIDLQPGSVIDVSGGGEIQANGQWLMNDGIPEGTGGSLSLITYSTNTTVPYGSTGVPLPPVAQPINGQIVMDGTIRSEGFAGGGTLTLQGTGFQIGGDPAQTPVGDLYLPANFFAQQGFGSYVLNALYDATVAPGTTVALTQQNLIPTAALLQTPTGADINAAGLTTSGTLDPYHRQATNLVLTAGAYLAWRTGSDGRPGYAGVTGGVTLGSGAEIVGDAGASIGLGSPVQVTVLGSIIAPGGSITLSADSLGNGYALTGQEGIGDGDVSGFTSSGKSVWIGSNAVLDVAGVALTNPLAAPVKSGTSTFIPDTGKVLPGGSVIISDDSGYVVAQAGSRIDVSGTSAVFDELQSSGQYASQAVWSNAGSITLAASSGLLFDGTLQAQPGAAQAQGGTLSILPDQTPAVKTAQPGGGLASQTSPGAQILIFQQDGNAVPAVLVPGGDIAAALPGSTGDMPTGILTFSTDRLSGSGISTLVVGSNLGTTPVAFEGNVSLTLPGSVVINTGQILALSSGQMTDLGTQLETAIKASVASNSPFSVKTAGIISSVLQDESPDQVATQASINAPYVALIGAYGSGEIKGAYTISPDEVVSASTLNVNASFIDLENLLQIDNFGQSTFSSSGDIRLTSTLAAASSGDALTTGELFSAGNLTFQAADLYPSTGTTYILDAVGPTGSNGTPAPTTITFLGNGASSVPLSAGGTLLVDATDIVQQGTVRAPSGSIVLGVGNASDTTTQTEFDALPIVGTQSVTLADGSVTSVSNDGAIIPYGTTVDGVEWQFNPIPNAKPAPDLTAPPAKYVGISGNSITLSPGATIDLSGGGDLQAEEWVSGTGGTRDVLTQYNVSYTNSATGTAVPTNVGAVNTYAIVPGTQSPVAAYDPIFAQSTQPATSTGGSTTTVSMGVGHSGLTDAVGESVYLSGVAGLPAGYYTLLPAKYATLPGAYRVTLASTSGAVTPGATEILPDGTVAVAGYFANSLTGTRSATPVLLDVQSSAVWQQYSQYTLTSANSYFPPLAAGAGDVTPPLPTDGGQLVLAANQQLGLGATLKTSAADGGAPAEVDIASQAIQIVGNGEAALPGYVEISADQLDALDAGSLLIGGTRTQTTSGVTITPIATNVVVSNDAASPLTGPEVMLVASNDINVEAGSAIAAQGAYPAAKDEPITIATSAATSTSDGALLRVSNGEYVDVTRSGQVNGTGVLSIAAGASLSGGNALTLDSTGSLTSDPSASLSGQTIDVQGAAITFTSATGAAASLLPGFVIGPALMAQLAKSQDVMLRSSGTMYFDGSPDVTFGNDVELSAGVFKGDGSSATINAPYVTFDNALGASDPASVAGSGTLTVNAGRIDFGNGSATVSGFGSVALNATGGIVAEGTGTFNFGAVPMTLSAPAFIADTGSGATIETTGALALHGAQGTALALTPLGGEFSFIGGAIDVNGATISAPAGNVSLEATSGNLTIEGGSTISAAGVAKQFYDVTEYAPAGAISLTADTGSVTLAADSILDFSGAAAGGAAGSLTVSAPVQTVNLAGEIKGAAATGYAGGSLSLTTGGAVDLDSLASELAASGVNTEIAVQTGSGNLSLSSGNTLTAHTVLLAANGGAGGPDSNNGNVAIDGTINAAGIAGGTIELYGKSSVDIEGSLIATGSSATEQGGTVYIATTGNGSTTSLNTTYGYENVLPTASGVITVGNNAVIDVTGGTAGGLSDGTVTFRAPLLSDGTVDVFIAPGAQIKGSRATGLQAFAVWSTDDQSTSAAQHFDGIVDPAGWYDSNGNLLAGTFTSQDGSTTITYTPANGSTPASLSNEPGASPAQVAADLAADLENDYFTPTTANANHETFYGYANGNSANGAGTLMGYVENGVQSVANQFAGTTIQNFAVIPAIDLDNPDPKINNGNISILTNWNLGAGSSEGDLAYRFDGQAPVITFRAENEVLVKASLTDGFFQIANPLATLKTVTIGPPKYWAASGIYRDFYYNQFYAYNYAPNIPYGPKYKLKYGKYGSTVWSNPQYFQLPPAIGSVPVSSKVDSTDTAAAINQYFSLYMEYFFEEKAALGNSGGAGKSPTPGQPTFSETAPTATQEAANPDLYQVYFSDYEAYIQALLAWRGESQNGSASFQWVPLQPPPVIATLPITTETFTVGSTASTDNSPSPVETASNPLPLQFATLMSGNSTTFNIVSGANIASANPLAVQSRASFAPSAGSPDSEQGSVVLSGNFAYDNAYNPVDANGLTVLEPTTIRTGSGSINVAAANNVWLYDPGLDNEPEAALINQAAPLLQSTVAVIYTAGTPAPGSPVGSNAGILLGNASGAVPNTILSPTVSPQGAGNISITAQNDINGLENVVDSTGAVSGVPGANIGQLWSAWLTPGNVTNAAGQVTQTSVDFGNFDQGVMSVGGNVSVSAGRNVTDLEVSLPTTWYQSTDGSTTTVVGGGNLSVTAGGNIQSGEYFVAQGSGTLSAGGQITMDGSNYTYFAPNNQAINVSLGSVPTLLATLDGSLDLVARQGIDIGSVFGPAYFPAGSGQVASSSSVTATTVTGEVDFDSALQLPGTQKTTTALPASINLLSLGGGIAVASGGTLAVSPTSELSLIADGSISLSGNTVLQMANETPALIDETDPVRIYSLNGSIVDGLIETSGGSSGFYAQLLDISVDKPAFIEAAQDIVNLSFYGQNLQEDDVTRIIAGHDIYDTPLVGAANSKTIPALVLGGPGYFDIEAGRNIGPLTSQLQVYDSLGAQIAGLNVTTGIDAVGNSENSLLPHASANVDVLFGVAPGIDDADFISTYINPSSNPAGVPSSTAALVAFMEQYGAGEGYDSGLQNPAPKTLTTQVAWQEFQALPKYIQQLFVEQVFFGILTDVGNDYNNSSSPYYDQYARGYQAINTLFPSSLGYTANDLGGGTNGANSLVQTGNLDIRNTTIQTQQGGNVSILGPGGQALVGSQSAPPEIVQGNTVLVGPGTQGILTLENGDINIFTDQSLLLAQSRVFTEQGGNMTIWSSNGDIDAGKGATSSADIPPPMYVCDVNHFCTLDAKGEVTGAGIATLQTIPGAATGDVNLLAPRGTVDAGAAGIRVSGNLNVAALKVANIANIQVQGKSTGVPVVASVDTGALTAASAANSAVAQMAENLTHNAASAGGRQWRISVQVEGFGDAPSGGGGPEQSDCSAKDGKKCQ